MTSLDFAKLGELVAALLSCDSGYPSSAIKIFYDGQAQILIMTIDLSATPSSGPKAAAGVKSPHSLSFSSCIDIYPNDP